MPRPSQISSAWVPAAAESESRDGAPESDYPNCGWHPCGDWTAEAYPVDQNPVPTPRARLALTGLASPLLL